MLGGAFFPLGRVVEFNDHCEVDQGLLHADFSLLLLNVHYELLALGHGFTLTHLLQLIFLYLLQALLSFVQLHILYRLLDL